MQKVFALSDTHFHPIASRLQWHILPADNAIGIRLLLAYRNAVDKDFGLSLFTAKLLKIIKIPMPIAKKSVSLRYYADIISKCKNNV